jgi:putative membrane protein
VIVMDGAFVGGFGLMALLTFILNIAFVVVVVAIAIVGLRWLVRSLNTPAPGPPAASSEDSALVVLRERFARGEIDADEYEQRRRTLGG